MNLVGASSIFPASFDERSLNMTKRFKPAMAFSQPNSTVSRFSAAAGCSPLCAWAMSAMTSTPRTGHPSLRMRLYSCLPRRLFLFAIALPGSRLVAERRLHVGGRTLPHPLHGPTLEIGLEIG